MSDFIPRHSSGGRPLPSAALPNAVGWNVPVKKESEKRGKKERR